MMHRGMYGFTVNRNKPLEKEAERAVDRIYTAGLMISNNVVTPGGNNVMADAAAEAFTKADLAALYATGEERPILCADIIKLRQQFAAAGADSQLQNIYNAAQQLKARGWKPSSEPHRMSGPRPV